MVNPYLWKLKTHDNIHIVKVGSSNGKTLDFDSSNGGSNPSPTSKGEISQ